MFFQENRVSSVDSEDECTTLKISFSYAQFLHFAHITSQLPDIYYFFESTYLNSVPDRSMFYVNLQTHSNLLEFAFTESMMDGICKFEITDKNNAIIKLKCDQQFEESCIHQCSTVKFEPQSTETILTLNIQTRFTNSNQMISSQHNLAYGHLKVTEITKTSAVLDLSSIGNTNTCQIKIQKTLMRDETKTVPNCLTESESRVCGDKCDKKTLLELELGVQYILELSINSESAKNFYFNTGILNAIFITIYSWKTNNC